MSNDEFQDIARTFHEGYQSGMRHQLAITLQAIKARICFDYIQNGGCDHASCWSLKELSDTLSGEKNK